MPRQNSARRPSDILYVFLSTVLCLYVWAVPAQELSLSSPANLRIALPESGPYQHVSPSDVGHTIGVGVTGPIPTTVWTASTRIEVPGTVIENVVVNGCLDVYADNVTIRNVIVNCGGYYAIDIKAENLVIENSKINCTSTSKVILATHPVGLRVSRNEILGCTDFFYIDGNVEGMLVEDNFMHSVIGPSTAHADGFQIGERSDTYGNMTIRGNYIWKNNSTIGATDIVFVTNYSRITLFVEDNFLRPWGWYTLRCNSVPEATTCIARNNIYSLEFHDTSYYPSAGFDEFTCNRYEDGTLLDENSEDTSNCTPFIK